MQNDTRSEGYIAAKRFLRDYPRWFHVLKASAVEAVRVKGEFAGAWVLSEAKRFGVDWFPNLRPLVSYKILRRTDVVRGGRRAYYVMSDVEGVNAALKETELAINQAATEALGSAMNRFTFGIVGDAKGGVEGLGLGTGVGLHWRDTYLVLTAAHAVEDTPYERLYFLLPDEALHFQGSEVTTQPAQLKIRKRFQLEKPKVLLADGEDLAAFVLEGQRDAAAGTHFYELDETCTNRSTTKQAGFLGYAAATRMAIGQNFMATPYAGFGDVAEAPSGYDSQSMLSVSYPAAEHLDPAGLSGSGLWAVADAQTVWTPEIFLVGLVTCHDPKSQALVGYKTEKVMDFLKTNQQWMHGKSD